MRFSIAESLPGSYSGSRFDALERLQFDSRFEGGVREQPYHIEVLRSVGFRGPARVSVSCCCVSGRHFPYAFGLVGP
jgi:hypothetical protein